MESNNKLIAEFMGMANERHSDGRYLFTTDIDELKGADTRFWEELYFHVSWDWLMPVVEKIESLRDTNGNAYRFTIDMCNAQIEGTTIEVSGGSYKRDATYQAVVEFIKTHKDETKV
tara:strand:- start:63 stop:413 length:351 start_codon:yes stop_codon:yes gene_type:complete